MLFVGSRRWKGNEAIAATRAECSLLIATCTYLGGVGEARCAGARVSYRLRVIIILSLGPGVSVYYYVIMKVCTCTSPGWRCVLSVGKLHSLLIDCAIDAGVRAMSVCLIFRREHARKSPPLEVCVHLASYGNCNNMQCRCECDGGC